MAFNHENLKVYQRTLSFNAKVGLWTVQWDSKHAICDQLSRAAGSMLENIAMASASHSSMKHRALDYAIGSGLECAACMDLARIKSLLDAERVFSEKEELSELLWMLVGLRKSWDRPALAVRENGMEYRAELESSRIDKACDKAHDKALGEKALFHHETLDAYRISLEVAEAFSSAEATSLLPTPVFRRLDELLTSMVLNIAEGNGRFSDTDQARFLGTSHESAIKLATRLDLCVAQDLLRMNDVSEWKILIERVSAITFAMIKSNQE